MTTDLHTLRRLAAQLAGASLIVAAGAAGAGDAAGVADVGRVSLLIGDARVVRADGSQHILQRGAQILVGDRIETSANGHVHMRFVDNAAVSVRPDSSLEVQAYRYDAARPETNEIRLRVEKGTSRSISGAATDLDKSRFRLNTPIAAIGVRGTDFIVQTDPTGVRATVSDGAIVVGALGGACLAAGLGPCGGVEARELSVEMGRLMAEVRPGDHATRIVPAADLSVARAASRSERGESTQPLSLSTARAIGLAAAEPTPGELQRGNDRAAAELLTLAAVNVPDLNRASNLSGQLIWGRYAVRANEYDKLTVPFALARLGRHVTVGSAQNGIDDGVGLFRLDQSGSDTLFPVTGGGKVEFRLNRASATYEYGAAVEAAHVNAGNLTIDFSRRTFATALDLTSTSGATGELRVAGSVRPDGIFTVRDTDQFVSGAISLDAKEAGYLFERGAGVGLFRGRTLWGR